ADAARETPPIKRMLGAGVNVGAGTDATRVASYNPWVCLYWLVTGNTVGGLNLYPEKNCLDRETALKLWTSANTWFSNEEGVKGQIKAGQLADFAVLSDDFFSIAKEEIKDLASVMTVVGGKIVYGSEEFGGMSPELPPAMPDWSPVRYYGGYQSRSVESRRFAQDSVSFLSKCCSVHLAPKNQRNSLEEVMMDWSLGCSCWAF
ncbi:MAG: amidohydrolase family protein, partial [Bdellovibrio sp.]|nr:amidohydrolase family protein [Bdellovibrio sp.]